MKLVARAPIEGVAGVVPDQRPGDTFDCEDVLAINLVGAGLAEEVIDVDAKHKAKHKGAGKDE